MKKPKTAITTICLLWAAVAIVLTSEAATIYPGSVLGIDQVQQTITFKTKDGRTWTLPVRDSNILGQKQIVKGDRVRIEVELSDSDLSKRITKITKIHDQPLPESTQHPDEVRP